MIYIITILVIESIFLVIPFMIKKKEVFWIYLVTIVGLSSIFWCNLYIEITFTSTFSGFLIVPIPLILFVLSIPPILGIVIKLIIDFRQKEYEDTLFYFVWQKFKYKLVSKTIKLTIAIVLIFQLFLLRSAYIAHTQAKELNYIDNNTSIWSFYSPFVKEIRLHDKRYSYRREIYVDYPEQY